LACTFVVDRDHADLHHPGLPAEAKHAAKQARDRRLVALAEPRDRRVIGRLVAGDYAVGDVLDTVTLDQPRGPLPARIRLSRARASLARLQIADALAIEDLFFGQNVRTAFAVGQARGVALLAAGQRGTGCFSYTPQQIKGAVCGSGRAAKDQVARMVAALLALPQPPRPDHAADALAVAVCHAQQAPLAAAVQRAGGSSPHPVAIEVVGAS
jgi:crossover junction endodeoxyribonuclease RuvC